MARETITGYCWPQSVEPGGRVALTVDIVARPFTQFLLGRPHALRDPLEARGAARLGQRRRRPRLTGADPPRPVAGRSAGPPVGPEVRGAPFHLAVSAR